MKKFMTVSFDTSIGVIEVMRETEQSVYFEREGVRGPEVIRRAKVSDFGCFHDTWEAAHAHLLKRAEGKLIQARRALELAQGEYGNVKGMKKPADPLQSKE